ncbi:MAG: cyclic nucleotide-binding protein [Desulfuromonas sp.]|nr:MAG: cyclic nucleotide-binding protein [Desulfuromonas sp.]
MGLTRQLRDTEPFKHLPEEVYEDLNQASEVRKFPPHTHIFNQDDTPTGYLYVIKQGVVEIVALTPGGGEMIVDYRNEGSFFGGTPVFTSEGYTAGARTASETECYLIPEDILIKIDNRYPQITEYFNKALYSRVRSLYSEMVNDHSQKALTQMEAYPFQKRLSEIMSSPVETCDLSTPVRSIAQRMTLRGIGAIMVTDDSNKPIGIITERDLVSKVLAREDAEIKKTVASDVMTANPHSMSPDTYMYEATTFMMAHKIKHMPIMEGNVIVGIVTMQDLMRFRSQKSMLLVGNVKNAKTIEELVSARKEIVKVARALMSETRSAFETMEILSYVHHRLLQRCYEIVLEEAEDEGLSPPDIRFCLMIMGSGGRKEMLLNPDQDNGFIYENFPDEKQAEVDAFFVPFSERLVTAFEKIGYPLCNGEVMVNNPLWRGRLCDWQKRLAGWFGQPAPKSVMYSTIFLDFHPLVGEASLCSDLHDIVHSELRNNPGFFYYMVENDLKHKPPVGIIKKFVLEKDKEHKGELSLKQSGSVFIVDCVRMFLLEQGIDAITTIERLDKLVELEIFNQETAEHLKAALESFTFLRLRHEVALIEQGEKPTHYIDPYSLPKNEQDLLQEAFRAAAKLQDSTRRHFGQGIL